jgi:hypothetical protein
MAPAHSSTHQDSAAHLRGLAGGLPGIQIVLDLESDLTSIRSAGIDGAAVPRLLPRPGRALTGETA